jgi:hypothetical protein
MPLILPQTKWLVQKIIRSVGNDLNSYRLSNGWWWMDDK